MENLICEIGRMQQPVKKRQRSENWLDEDKLLLKKLVRERVRAIENKNTDTNSNSMKVAAWKDLRESFNCMCKGSPRTVIQLKTQWGLIKMKTKKVKEERKELLMIGDGPPPITEGVSSEDVSSWLHIELTTDNNEFDSDQINRIVEPPQSPILPENIKTEVDVPPPNPSPPGNIKEMSVVEPSEPSPPPMASGPQLKKQTNMRKKVPPVRHTAAEQIAAVEIQCRKELHAIQMKNEHQKNKNLKLKEILLQEKIKFYKKNNDYS